MGDWAEFMGAEQQGGWWSEVGGLHIFRGKGGKICKHSLSLRNRQSAQIDMKHLSLSVEICPQGSEELFKGYNRNKLGYPSGWCVNALVGSHTKL